MQTFGSGTPLACDMDAIPPPERVAHAELIAHLFGTPAGLREEIPGGYAFHFSAAEFDNVARFVANERKCCRFLAFELTLAPAEGSLRLGLTGPEGTRDFLAAELGL